ncbi:TonB-dependent receptor [Myxococcus sp. CA040A]|uniref:TonB-dependent receptor n=1 Tax=Myxococcus sp. CA040A TaxID=2741738 RepID=UPI00157A8D98|nr:TonB-dependent receptor [Myxococcus sp. CA040A]NTX02992.1 TonB-dependent receptor [Myxococcus sp. CA040A]
MRNLTVFHVVVGVLVGMSQAPTARAEPTSSISGTVIDALSRQPLGDVVVTASASEPQGEFTVVTEMDGTYRIEPLPPGTYELRFEKEQFIPLTRDSVLLREARALRVNVELIPGPLGEMLEFRCWTLPSLDYESTGVSESFDHLITDLLPIARPIPGSAMRSVDRLQSLRSEAVDTDQGLTLLGASPSENGYVLDGLSTQDGVFGRNAVPLSLELLQYNRGELLFRGRIPQYGRATGAIIDAGDSNSGSNEFNGSVFAHWATGLLQGRQPVQDGPHEALQHMGELGAVLSGPILKDQLWFSLGLIPSVQRVESTRRESTLSEEETSPTVHFDQRELQALGRLTYLFNASNRTTLTFITIPATQRWHEGATAFAPRALERDTLLLGLGHSGALLDNALLLDIDARWLRQHFAQRPAPSGETGADTKGLACGSTLLARYTRCGDEEHDTNQFQVRGWARHRTYRALGISKLQQTLKVGLDAEWLVHEAVQRVPSTQRWPPRGLQAVPPSIATRTNRDMVSGFVQGSWAYSYFLTVNAGLRYDMQRLLPAHGETRAISHALSPQLGVVVDPFERGEMRLFAHYGKYRGQTLLGLLLPDVSGEQVRDVEVDPHLSPASTSEATLGAAVAVLRETVLSVTYARRELDTGLGLMSNPGGDEWRLVNPGNGLGSDLPRMEQTHDAVTLELARTAGYDWMGQVSYTWSRFGGSREDPLNHMLRGTSAVARRTHVLKASGARRQRLTPALSARLGLAYVAASGTLEAGQRASTPWLHVVDARFGMDYHFDRGKALSFDLDAFNLFNIQTETRMTSSSDGPTVALEHQPPRQVRFGARYTF